LIELLLSQGIDINRLDSLKSSLLDFTTNLRGGNLEATKRLSKMELIKVIFLQRLNGLAGEII